MKHTTIFATIFAIAMLFCISACGKEDILSDGTYTGKTVGHNAEITIEVTIKNGSVSNAQIISQKESPGVGLPAAEQIVRAFVEQGNTTGIDVVSGATITSRAVLSALNKALVAAHKKKNSSAYKDTECDIVIIGAGGAGLVAATEATCRGAKVIVLEKMGIVGGNTNYSTGGINASYTKEQKRLGIVDSTDVFFDDIMAGGYYLNDPQLVRTLVDNSAAMVEWLQSDLIGADLSDVGMFGGATNKRIHRPKGGGAIGVHLVPRLHKAALVHGADIRLNNKAIDILSDNGKACGVRVAAADTEYTISAKAVIIATGGFGANIDMVSMYQPSLSNFGTTNHKGATGDAFQMVEKFNADITQMTQIQIHPTVVPNTNIMITEAVRGNGAILVYRDGKRFIDELGNRDIVSAAILTQPGRTAFLVFDQGVRDSLNAIEDYVKQNLLTKGSSITELAGKLHIPAITLEKTVASYNESVKKGVDEAFKRSPASMERPLNIAPYYAVECGPAIHHTMGGLKINTKAEVLNKNGKPIPALYAAGEVTGGLHGGNRLGGNAVADICIFGKIAADSALAYIGK